MEGRKMATMQWVDFPDERLPIDGVNPNDVGFLKMAEGLEGPVRKALGLEG
jgi:hypothetical protein